MERTTVEVQKEYAQHCAQAGETQYRIKVLEGQLFQLNQKISELNTEAEKLKESQDGQKE
jgi:predicted nuclease with TOPRIM domain